MSPRCPTSSLLAITRLRCRRSVTGSGPGRSTCSSSGGCTGCRRRSAPRTATRATGGRPRCGRWRSPAPSSSTRCAMPAASSRHWLPTTSTSAARTTWRSSSPARSAATPGGLPDRDRPPRQRRRPGQCLLQALADQAVPPGREGDADRDRRQRPPQSAYVRANVCKVVPEVHRLASRMSWTWSAA